MSDLVNLTVKASRLAARQRVTAEELVGLHEIATTLQRRYRTTTRWRERGVLPPPFVVRSRTPLWTRAAIEQWARRTGRWPADASWDAGRATACLPMVVLAVLVLSGVVTTLLVFVPQAAGAVVVFLLGLVAFAAWSKITEEPWVYEPPHVHDTRPPTLEELE